MCSLIQFLYSFFIFIINIAFCVYVLRKIIELVEKFNRYLLCISVHPYLGRVCGRLGLR